MRGRSNPARAREVLCEQLQTASLAGHGLEDAAGRHRRGRRHRRVPARRRSAPSSRTSATSRWRVASDALLIDPATLRHLNVVEGVEGGRDGSLLDTIDRTMTAMGGRLLRQWLLRPLVALARVQDRLDAVEDFAFRTTERGKLRDLLRDVPDLERLMARIALGTAGSARPCRDRAGRSR